MAVDRTTAALAEALRTGDVAAAGELAGPEPEAAGARERLQMMVANAAALRLRGIALAYRAAEGPAAESDGTWQVRWRPGDRGVHTAMSTVPVSFAMHDGRAVVTDLPARPTQVWWLSAPLRATRGTGWQVVTADVSPPGALVAATRRARAAVGRVLGRAPTLVVEAPADAPTYDQLLGAQPGEFAALAAVTTTADGGARRDAALRIVVNPDQRGRMDRTGLAVVLAHEAVHVAVRDVVSPQPRWLSEGFADLVALRGLGLPGRTAAVAAQVRREGVPERLPAGADFDGSGTALEAAYEASRLVCAALERRLGLAGLVALRRSLVRHPEPFAAAVSRAGWSQPLLLARWRARLSSLSTPGQTEGRGRHPGGGVGPGPRGRSRPSWGSGRPVGVSSWRHRAER